MRHSDIQIQSARKIDSINVPILINNFKGNQRGNSIPMDNSMAVSRNGFIVSAINSNVIFALPDGTLTYTRNLSDFYKILGLGTSMFDPRVAYDPEYNRFILVALHGSEPSNSYLCIAFSKTEDPNGEWNYYKIKGDNENDGVWFDFPNIAISTSELFIAGNMFTSEGGYQYSSIIQIDKKSAYTGAPILYKFYSGINNSNGWSIFNPVPVMSGLEKLTDDMVFISNSNSGFDLNVISNTLMDDPFISNIRVEGSLIPYPPDAKQKNSKVLLSTGGNRIRCAILQNGIIHFASQAGTSIGTTGIYYGRINLFTKELTFDILSQEGIDMAYPTITSFGENSLGDVILVNYTFAGENALPGMATRTVTGQGNDFIWSDEVITKFGTSPIGTNPASPIRWGDYSGACRRFIDHRVESWVCGTYGMNNAHNTWIGQYLAEPDANKNLEFTAFPSTTEIDSLITLTDVSGTTPNYREWIVKEGLAISSTSDSMITVSYNALGDYDIALVHHFPTHSDTLLKEEYIHIIKPETIPMADWTLDKDTIFVGDSIQFTSLSSINSLNHKWTFINGLPVSSTQTNPNVKYNKKGTFLVSLTVNNIAGTNTLTRPKAVTVLQKSLPKSDFSASEFMILEGDTVRFENFSIDGNQYAWHFEGGSPESSHDVTPIIIYDTPGEFDVTLITTNAFGSDTLTKHNYITVGVNSTDDSRAITQVKIAPNPIVRNEPVLITFENKSTQHCNISLMDVSGKLIKVLYDNKVKSGLNALTFNSGMLQMGLYFIVFATDVKFQEAAMIQIVE
ncbi:MAG: PKD domain-containing protein [Saprospiraceae bacterium]